MPATTLTHRIRRHRANARYFTRLGKRRHFNAAFLARRALVAKQNGRHLRAAALIRRALGLKAAAARAIFRAKLHRARIAAIRRARRARAR